MLPIGKPPSAGWEYRGWQNFLPPPPNLIFLWQVQVSSFTAAPVSLFETSAHSPEGEGCSISFLSHRLILAPTVSPYWSEQLRVPEYTCTESKPPEKEQCQGDVSVWDLWCWALPALCYCILWDGEGSCWSCVKKALLMLRRTIVKAGLSWLSLIFLTWNIAQSLRYSRKDPQKLVDLKYKTCVQPTADCRQSLHTNPGPLDEGEFYSNFCCFASNAVTVQFQL